MSFVARVKRPRADRGGSGRRRRKMNVVERVWAYQTMTELTEKAMQATDNTARTIVLATVKQIGSEVCI